MKRSCVVPALSILWLAPLSAQEAAPPPPPPDYDEVVFEAKLRGQPIAAWSLFVDGSGVWTLRAATTGRIAPVTNTTLADLAGPQIAFQGGFAMRSDGPILFRDLRVNAQKLNLTANGRVGPDTTTIITVPPGA